tara:strand:+ start:347 stop:730 length:384 start_codon:yes stop_codon:yes gene_type:complete
VNAQLSLILLISLFFINGCSILPKFWGDDVKPIEVKQVAVERIKLNIESPKPLQPEKIEWVVITPDNVDKVWKKLKSKNKDLVLFGLTDDGYEKLSINMAEIRNFINTQRIIILKYKDYYEKDDSDN